MDFLLRSVTITDKNSPYNEQRCDVRITGNRIAEVGQAGTLELAGAKEIDGNGQYLSPGWVDLRAFFCDPGLEHKEDLESGCNAAAAGGFTTVAVHPETDPIVQTKSIVEYIRKQNQHHVVEAVPVGALTQKLEGQDISEMYDMHLAGAIAFSNGNHPVKNAGVMQRALLYTKGFNGLIMTHAEDTNLSQNGQVHEGIISTQLGFKGMPAMSEHVVIHRDLELVRYLDARLHFSHISTKEAVELIRQAKAEGLQVTCDVAVHQLALNHEVLTGFDTNYKTNPPLRTEEDRLALLKGLADGTIDAITSDHQPQDPENKMLEFDEASYGIISLQTVFPVALQATGNTLSLSGLVDVLSHHPRRLLGLQPVHIAAGQTASLTLFNPAATWVFDENTNQSRSHNSPWLGQTLTGQVTAVFNRGKAWFND